MIEIACGKIHLNLIFSCGLTGIGRGLICLVFIHGDKESEIGVLIVLKRGIHAGQGHLLKRDSLIGFIEINLSALCAGPETKLLSKLLAGKLDRLPLRDILALLVRHLRLIQCLPVSVADPVFHGHDIVLAVSSKDDSKSRAPLGLLMGDIRNQRSVFDELGNVHSVFDLLAVLCPNLKSILSEAGVRN